MSTSGRAGAAAYNPTVLVNGHCAVTDPAQQARQQRVLDCEAAVVQIKSKMAALQVALAAAEAEAGQARREAQEGQR